MGNPVVHFEIVGTDAAALRVFYSGLFGWQLDADNPVNYAAVARESNVNAHGVGIGGGIGPVHGGGPGYVTVYVEVPDVGVALEQVRSLGGTPLFGPDEVPGTGVILGQFTDPDGHIVGLMQASG